MSNATWYHDQVSRPSLLPPIGLRLTRTARVVSNAFERAMAEAGGSASAWQVRDIAAAIGIESATLTHHLNSLEQQGLVRRWRDAGNRRGQQVALTEAGEALFAQLRQVAATHDRRLRSHLTDEDTAQLADLLEKLQAGIEPPEAGRA